MRRLTGALVMLLAAGSARAGEGAYLGGGAAAATVPGQMLGDSRKVTAGLGLTQYDLRTSWFSPQLGFGFELDEHLGLDVQATWMADGLEARGTTPIAYRVRRDVVPVSAMLRVMGAPHALQILLGAGPTLGVTRFWERGWLGDGTSWDLTYGATARLAFRSPDRPLRFLFGLGLTWMHLPAKNPLVRDGGGATSGGLTLGVEYAL